MKRILLFVAAGVAALLVVVGVGGGTAYLVIKSLGGAPASSARDGEPEIALTKENIFALKPFVTNLAMEPGGRPQYISVTFELVLRKPEDKAQIETNLPLIRDSIVAVLSAKKSQEVSGEAGANTLKNDVLARLNKELGAKSIQKVLITDLVVQY